ncbi:MAG: hypothetical protein GX309_09550, partial [Clostridiales bacterium]|nr:hypothetical protein [Clostridiales bacterium]
MEYRIKGDGEFTAITGTEVTGLAAGTYEVRLAAKTGYNAGATAEVVVEDYVAPPVTYEVTVDGDATVTDDYTITGAEDLTKVETGTDLTITAVTDITVNGDKIEIGSTKVITVSEATTITISKYVAPLDKSAIDTAISAANAAKADVVIDTDAANVEPGTYWVTTEVNAALELA